MILFDTNVLIYAFQPDSEFYEWSHETLTNALADSGAAINPVILAELCAGDHHPETVESRLEAIGLRILPLKSGIAATCAQAFRQYLKARRSRSGSRGNKLPLPDFFIGAQASVHHLPLATADTDRYAKYFPSVKLIHP